MTYVIASIFADQTLFMKITRLAFAALILTLPLLFSSCSKYEENKWISVIPKEKRLYGNWEMTYLSHESLNAVEVEFIYVTFNEDNSFQYWASGDDANNGWWDEGLSGTWQWGDKKSKLVMTFEDGTTEDWVIDRLQIADFWVDIQSSKYPGELYVQFFTDGA